MSEIRTLEIWKARKSVNANVMEGDPLSLGKGRVTDTEWGRVKSVSLSEVK